MEWRWEEGPPQRGGRGRDMRGGGGGWSDMSGGGLGVRARQRWRKGEES